MTGTGITVEVQQGRATFEREYPCLAAVDRASATVERHAGRVIWLTYTPPGPVTRSLYLVGKGITYDTGGADIKAGGVMAGMSRDKCGAAAVVGLLKTVAELKPAGVKVVGALCMVRNSVGEESYVADEIITSRAGVRLRVGNTDAEGRMAMVDVLCRAKELALSDPGKDGFIRNEFLHQYSDPQLMTVATLTGHAVLAMGGYSIIMDNGPARAAGVAGSVQRAGDTVADPFEISTVRREDWDFVKAIKNEMNLSVILMFSLQDKSGEFCSVLQCNNAPSSRTPRGHQFPAAFMMKCAGLDQHMIASKQPLKAESLYIDR